MLVQGDSSLVLNYVLGEWRCHQPHLAEVLDSIRALIRHRKLRVAFQWIPRGQNNEADDAARVAHDRKKDVVLVDELTRLAVHDVISMAATDESPAEDSPEEGEALQGVRIKRPRGRPKKLLKADFRKATGRFRVKPD